MTLMPNNVTTVAQLNILNQRNDESINIHDVSTSSTNIEYAIDSKTVMCNLRDRVTSYNAVEQISNAT